MMKKENNKNIENTENLLNKVEGLESQIIEMQEQIDEAKQNQLRAFADLQNFQRRENENKINWSRDAIGSFLDSLLPRFVELKISLEHTEDKNIKKTIDSLFKTLENLGFEKINPKKNEPIDTDFHEVLLTEKGKKGCVVNVLEPGWKFQNKVIKPAKVSGAEE